MIRPVTLKAMLATTAYPKANPVTHAITKFEAAIATPMMRFCFAGLVLPKPESAIAYRISNTNDMTTPSAKEMSRITADHELAANSSMSKNTKFTDQATRFVSSSATTVGPLNALASGPHMIVVEVSRWLGHEKREKEKKRIRT